MPETAYFNLDLSANTSCGIIVLVLSNNGALVTRFEVHVRQI